MRNLAAASLAALALLIAGAGSGALAQTLSGSINQPPVSPYINILRGGAPAGVNYYNIVQPQLQFYSAINQLQSQQRQQAASMGSSSEFLSTGHEVQFGNLSHFYPQQGGGGSFLRIGQSPATLGAQSLQQRFQQNLPTRNLGTAPTGQPVRSSTR